MEYDADHNRLARLDSNGNISFYLPDSDAVQAKGSTTITWHPYYMADGQRVAEDTGTLSGGTLVTRYFANDYQNSIGFVTDDTYNGTNPVETVGYDAFGKPRNVNGTADPTFGASNPEPRGYINQEMLPEVQLIDLNARYFDPFLAKFLAPDPVIGNMDDSQAWNPYAYGHNDPMSTEDPTGLLDGDGGSSSAGSGSDASNVAKAQKLAEQAAKESDGGPHDGTVGINVGGKTYKVDGSVAHGLAQSVSSIKSAAQSTNTLMAHIPAMEFDAETGESRYVNSFTPKMEPGLGDGGFGFTFALATGGEGLVLAKKAFTFLAEKAVAFATEEAPLVVREGIYEFTSKSGMTYVGQSGNIAARIDQHIASGKLLSRDLGALKLLRFFLGGGNVPRSSRINKNKSVGWS